MSDQFKCNAIVTRESDKAVRLNANYGAWTRSGFWVPRSILHYDNEVNHVGDVGLLVVPLWWAVQEGLQMGLSMPSSPLAVQKSTGQILAILDGYASTFEGRTQYEDALCDCLECSRDVIGWHVAKEIRAITAKLKAAIEKQG